VLFEIENEDFKKIVCSLLRLQHEYVETCKSNSHTRANNPMMRMYGDEECDPNPYMESARVIAASCIHECLIDKCSGQPTGEGCRFDFPKKARKYTVLREAVVNQHQNEMQVLTRRTSGHAASRVPHVNKNYALFWRANHDVSPVLDYSHTAAYVTKYASKPGKHDEPLTAAIELLDQRAQAVVPPTMKQAISTVVLASCAHRTFLTRHEMAFKAMQLKQVYRSFSEIKVVGIYNRATLKETMEDDTVVELSDRTEYSAYAERCRPGVKVMPEDANKANKKALIEAMCLREFCEMVTAKWKADTGKNAAPVTDLGPKKLRKFKTRDKDAGHWELRLRTKRRQIRWSTENYAPPAISYLLVEEERTDSQSNFHDMDKEKRHQLYR